eukprot:CAMPEP_0194776436 /NCGR_PEP_ID=MMETSP0323_2-20130528/63081_1 /TAXON_ID=2866 ORGANISM="Crypthecodinium cohnii, Strain Seligo" /NCGR_SAMPLE_ID=MMETSP0323_2 /ASSEMBLY_ACC=CAM_ASM_000346 /LENGTH=105 /DNA_ID=CAMNT_0039712851 /DNA_START=197 /DNA_END=511 /DNA_ORIENTATION=+
MTRCEVDAFGKGGKPSQKIASRFCTNSDSLRYSDASPPCLSNADAMGRMKDQQDMLSGRGPIIITQQGMQEEHGTRSSKGSTNHKCDDKGSAIEQLRAKGGGDQH